MHVEKFTLERFVSLFIVFKVSPEITCKKKAARQIIENSLYLCHQLARKLATFGYEYNELVNEGVFGLYHALDKFKLGRCEFSTYAYYWVWEYMRVFMRKSKSKNTKNLLSYMNENSEEQSFEIPSKEKEPAEYLEEREEKAEYEKILNRLNPRSRKILEMRADGKTLEEIGKEVNLTKEAVRQQIKKVIER